MVPRRSFRIGAEPVEEGLADPHVHVVRLAAVGVVCAGKRGEVGVVGCGRVEGVLAVAAFVRVVCVAQVQGDVDVPPPFLDGFL